MVLLVLVIVHQLVHLDAVHLALVDSVDLDLGLEVLAVVAHLVQQQPEVETVSVAAVGLAIVVSVEPDAIRIFAEFFFIIIQTAFMTKSQNILTGGCCGGCCVGG